MHTDAVVPLTGLSFNAVCMSLAEITLWLSLHDLLIDTLTDTDTCHTYFFQPVAKNRMIPHNFDFLAMPRLSLG